MNCSAYLIFFFAQVGVGPAHIGMPVFVRIPLHNRQKQNKKQVITLPMLSLVSACLRNRRVVCSKFIKLIGILSF